ncbi:MAG TPA: hypothetical protein VKV03_13670, partial [Candidatus Binataceae bacterium]|nr:hypothetical protein [Candidatus Binataceae bacterium]
MWLIPLPKRGVGGPGKLRRGAKRAQPGRRPSRGGAQRSPSEIKMIKPYTAVGLIPVVRGIRKREDIAVNL